ncbi:hypothetical protein KY320_04340 [Candidatus Woesearchaeota archaeon]|nr:hypothetical protein [Candidatus Woesearchaeota archaeon]
MKDPQIWRMFLSEKDYANVAAGRETTTGRAPDPYNPTKDYRRMNLGDVVIFTMVGEDVGEASVPIVKRVTGVKYFKSDKGAIHSVKRMLRSQGWHNMEPEANEYADAVLSYMRIPGYAARIEEHGVFSISFEPIMFWRLWMPDDLYDTFEARARVVEGRALDLADMSKDYRFMNRGDIVTIFGNTRNNLDKWVNDVRLYPSIEEMVAGEGLEALTPALSSVEEAVGLYNSFPGYPARAEAYGMAAIEMGGEVPDEIFRGLLMHQKKLLAYHPNFFSDEDIAYSRAH